jgi:hypothetical protein
VHVVAIAELATSLEAEAAALAADLGTTAYEERLKLAAGLPAIVLTAAEHGPARALAEKLRLRRHQVIVCDAATVVPSEAMIPVRTFAFEPDALVVPEQPGVRLPYDDVLALLRAVHKGRTETHAEVAGKQFSMGRAILTGGLMTSKKVTRDEKTVSEERDQVLYVFRRSGETPWLLRERGTHYAGLGAQLGPSSTQNFLAVIARLRAAAPAAFYDERLLNARGAPTRAVRVKSVGSESVSTSQASGVDLLAHLLARWVGARRTAP